ncbi:MAG: glutamyl-tRNA reductase [Nitrososphaerota archaeon]|nr:glutamyl-tRNA reductase [Nitrososphaerota archaeon]
MNYASKDSTLEIIAVGVSFKTAPIAVREEISKRITKENLVRLKEGNPNILELVLLSTCNRLEIYATCKDAYDVSRILYDLLSNGNTEENEYFYKFVGSKAVEHIFRVAAGLDSLVVGESQILQQIVEAPKKSADFVLSDGVLNRLFSKAHSLGSEIRESHMQGPNRSLSLSVVHFVERYFSSERLSSRPNIMLVGSGKMIRVAASSFDRSKIGSLVVMARTNTQPHSITADDFVDISELSRRAKEGNIDVILVATSAKDYLISYKDLEQTYAGKTDAGTSGSGSRKRLLIIDISFPRNVNPNVRSLESVVLYDLDDLDSDEEFRADVERFPVYGESTLLAESLIALRTNEFIAWMNQRYSKMTDILSNLWKDAELMRAEEVENAFNRAPELTAEEKEVISVMSERIVRRLLHDPSTKLNTLTRSGESNRVEEYAEVLKNLFAV